MVPDPQHALIGKAAVYARVSTHEQRDDLDRQAQRMTEFANAAGLSVVAVIKEVTSGVNDTGPKLTALLKEDSWGMLVVEHKDRLSRVGSAGSMFCSGCRAAGSWWPTRPPRTRRSARGFRVDHLQLGCWPVRVGVGATQDR